MTTQNGGKKVPVRFRFRAIWQKGRNWFRQAAGWYNLRMKRIYSPFTAAITGTLIVAVIGMILLFGPRFIGVADDGSLSGIMEYAGLGYRSQDLEDPMGAYAVRFLLHSGGQGQGISSHQLIIRLAVGIDNLLSHDNYFDLRVLGGIYLLLYLPAVFLVLRGLCSRVNVALEATALTLVGALILGDATYLSYFNTLYPEAMWIIFLTYLLGLGMMIPHLRNGGIQGCLMAFTACGILLIMTEGHCAAPGIILTLFCMRQIKMEGATHQIAVTAAICGAILLTASVFSGADGVTRFTESSKIHAMTNGVLTRSRNPEQTLAEFGIDARFETMADMSAYEDYPYATAGNPEIQRDFLSRYETGNIVLHYFRHPLEFLGMAELGTRAAFATGRSYVGTYEKSAGRKSRERNQLFTVYSRFRSNSMPHTLGFLAIIGGAYLVLFRKKRANLVYANRRVYRIRQMMLDTFAMLPLIGIADVAAVICLSGTVELERYAMLFGICIDGMILMFLAEILHRLNILGEG